MGKWNINHRVSSEYTYITNSLLIYTCKGNTKDMIKRVSLNLVKTRLKFAADFLQKNNDKLEQYSTNE